MISEVATPGAALAAPGDDAATAYRLNRHVRGCIDCEHVVFLDLRRNRYWSVPLRSAPRIDGLTPVEHEGRGKTNRLLLLDLIEPSITPSLALQITRSPAPESRIEPQTDIRPSTREQLSFWFACASASRALGAKRLDRTLEGLKWRKQHARPPRLAPARLVGIFEGLRPWYPHRRICLFDALALMYFALANGLRPDLVLGVRTAPFAAHCWIEIDERLAGDLSDHCASFTPIAWI